MSDELHRIVPPWHARTDAWSVAAPRLWGPTVADPRQLCSWHALALVAKMVGAHVPDVAERLLRAQPQQRYLLLGTLSRRRRCMVLGGVDLLLARAVAIKVPHERDAETAWKLVAEVQAMAQLDHVNVVSAFDMGHHDGLTFVALELCETDLDTWCVCGRPWAAVLDRLIEAGHGLQAVHATGLVHADVKPDNIFIKDGSAKLGDFGLAERPGCAMRIGGTPGYIAPEVADGQKGFAGDVFAFACTAWACLTGEPAFGDPPPTADSSAATLVLVERARDGQVQESSTDVPAAVLALLRTALQPQPEQRPSLDVLVERLATLRPGKQRGWRRLVADAGDRWGRAGCARRLVGGSDSTREEQA